MREVSKMEAAKADAEPKAVEVEAAAAADGAAVSVASAPAAIEVAVVAPKPATDSAVTRKRLNKGEAEDQTDGQADDASASATDAAAVVEQVQAAPAVAGQAAAGAAAAGGAASFGIGGLLSALGLSASPLAVAGVALGAVGAVAAVAGGGSSEQNRAPTAGADTGAATEGGAAATGSLAANDADADSDALTFALQAPVAGLTVGADGAWRFDPTDAAYDGLKAGEQKIVTATYTVSDGQGGTATATLTITVTGTNDAPTAVADVAAAVEDGQPVTGSVAGNDADVDGDALVYALDAPVAGLTLNADGSYSFDPSDVAYDDLNDGQTREVVAAYTVSDGHGGTASATLTITVSGRTDRPNTAPVVVADVAAVSEDGQHITGSLAANDSDAEGDTLTYTVTAGAPGLVINSDGSYEFDPGAEAYQSLAQGEVRVVTASYVVTDGYGGRTPSTLTITVTGTNDAPVATAAQVATNEDAPAITGQLAASDADAGDQLIFALTSDVPGLTLNPDGSYTFDPAFEYDSLDLGDVATVTAEYTVTDSHGAVSTAVLTILLEGRNDTPVVNSETLSLNEDGSAILGNVSGNDGDADADAQLTYSVVSAPAGFSMDADGWYRFDATNSAYQDLAEGQTRTVQAVYRLTDEHGASAQGTVSITITGTNDAPVARVDVAGVNEDAVVTGSVAANDADVDAGAVLTYAVVGAAPAGLTFNPDGSYSFSAAHADYQSLAQGQTRTLTVNYSVTDEHGARALSTLTLTITGTNDAPVVVGETAAVTEDAAVVTGSLAANDSDVDAGAVLTYALTAPVAGLTLNADGSYSFDPSNAAYDSIAQGEVRQVAVAYTVTDEHGAATPGVLTLSITGVNSAPIVAGEARTATENNGYLSGTVATNDSDPDGDALAYALVAPVAGLTMDRYGQYTFNTNDPAYDAMKAGDQQTIVATYVASDGAGGSTTGTLTITLTGANDAPVVVVDRATATEDAAVVTGSVAANDSDPDSPAALTYELVGTLAGLVMTSDGAWSFDPSAAAYQDLGDGEMRQVSVQYRATDAEGASSVSTLVITVTGANDAPVGAGDTYVVAEDRVLTIPRLFGVLANDGDVDGDALTAILQSGPSHGTLTLNANGGFSYTPDANYNGTDSFTYVPNDGTADGAPVTVQITVAPVGDLTVQFASVGTEFGPIGGEIRANTETQGEQNNSAVAGLAGGGYVVTWTDSNGSGGDGSQSSIKAQRFDASGQPTGDEFIVNTTTPGDQIEAHVAGLDGGGFVVTWTDYSSGTGDGVIRVQMFDADGAKVGGEFEATASTDVSQDRSDVTALAGGGFVVTWSDYADLEDNTGEVRAQIFDASGQPVGAEIAVNTAQTGYQYEPTVAQTPDGGFVVLWRDDNQGTACLQRFDSSGAKVGGEIVATPPGAYLMQASVTVLADGDAVVAWSQLTIPAFEAIVMVQRFNPAGEPVGQPQMLDPTAQSNHTNVTLTALDDGGYLAVWQDGNASTTGDGSATCVKAQRFQADGQASGPAYVVNTVTNSSQYRPAVDQLTDGGFAISWTDLSGTGDADESIKVQSYGPVPPFNAVEQVELDLKGKVALGPIDSDAPVITVTLSVDHGVLSVTPGASGASVSGDGTSSVTLTGTREQINALLTSDLASHLSYTSTGDTPPAQAVLNVVVSDGSDLIGQGAQILNITAVNDAPVVGTEATPSVTDHDAVISGALGGGDMDPDGDALTYRWDNDISGFVLHADGTWTFDPTAWRSLSEGQVLHLPIEYEVVDSNGAATPATLYIDITGLNDGPTAQAESSSVPEGVTNYGGRVQTRDSDSYNLVHELVEPLAGLSMSASGDYVFDTRPYAYLAQGEVLTVSTHYRVTDPEGASTESTISFTITGTSAGFAAVSATESHIVMTQDDPGAWQVDYDGLYDDLVPVTVSARHAPAFLDHNDAVSFTDVFAGEHDGLSALLGTDGSAHVVAARPAEFDIPDGFAALDPLDPLWAVQHAVIV